MAKFVGVNFSWGHGDGDNKISARTQNPRNLAKGSGVILEMLENFEEQNGVEKGIADGQLVHAHD